MTAGSSNDSADVRTPPAVEGPAASAGDMTPATGRNVVPPPGLRAEPDGPMPRPGTRVLLRRRRHRRGGTHRTERVAAARSRARGGVPVSVLRRRERARRGWLTAALVVSVLVHVAIAIALIWKSTPAPFETAAVESIPVELVELPPPPPPPAPEAENEGPPPVPVDLNIAEPDTLRADDPAGRDGEISETNAQSAAPQTGDAPEVPPEASEAAEAAETPAPVEVEAEAPPAAPETAEREASTEQTETEGEAETEAQLQTEAEEVSDAQPEAEPQQAEGDPEAEAQPQGDPEAVSPSATAEEPAAAERQTEGEATTQTDTAEADTEPTSDPVDQPATAEPSEAPDVSDSAAGSSTDPLQPLGEAESTAAEQEEAAAAPAARQTDTEAVDLLADNPGEESEEDPEGAPDADENATEEAVAAALPPGVVLPVPNPQREPGSATPAAVSEPQSQRQDTARVGLSEALRSVLSSGYWAPESSDGQGTAQSAQVAYTEAVRSAVAPGFWNAMQGIRGVGVVVVEVVIRKDGTVKSARVAQSSGDPNLDAASLSAARGAPYPPLPAAVGRETLTVHIPLRAR